MSYESSMGLEIVAAVWKSTPWTLRDAWDPNGERDVYAKRWPCRLRCPATEVATPDSLSDLEGASKAHRITQIIAREESRTPHIGRVAIISACCDEILGSV